MSQFQFGTFEKPGEVSIFQKCFNDKLLSLSEIMLRKCSYNNKLHQICEYLNLTYCLMLPDNDNTRLLNKVKWPLWSIGDNKSSKIMGFVNIV